MKLVRLLIPTISFNMFLMKHSSFLLIITLISSTSAFDNESIDWVNQINSTKTKCSLFPGKSKQLRNLFQKMTIDRSSTGKMAESIRREAAYKFCKALFPADFPKKWPEMEAKNWPTEQWSLGVHVSQVSNCPYFALLQPEARQMREKRDIPSKLRQQLGIFLIKKQHDAATEATVKEPTLRLCKFAFIPPETDNTMLIILIVCPIAGFILFLCIVLLLCYFLAWRRPKKKEPELPAEQPYIWSPIGPVGVVRKQTTTTQIEPDKTQDTTKDQHEPDLSMMHTAMPLSNYQKTDIPMDSQEAVFDIDTAMTEPTTRSNQSMD